MSQEDLNDYVSKVKVSYVTSDNEKWESLSNSLDVNDHFADVARQIEGAPTAHIKGGYFDVFWEGKRMFAGNGPSFSTASIALAASLEASIEPDIYCSCPE